MSKFVIECPVCGRYLEASTGFLGIGATKRLTCPGNPVAPEPYKRINHTFDVSSNKLASRTCPHCGNNVVFDQSKGEKAKCPVCGEPINTMAELDKTVEFSCAQCGVRLRTAKGANTYVCPVCDCVNDVAERVQTEKIKHDGLASIIKYEGDNSTFIWKHPIEDFNYGSQLIVHESQEAVFFRDGQALDTFGPGRYTLETQQLPLLEKLYKLPTDTEGTFHSEVYFINKTVQMAIKWGVPEVAFIDPLHGVPLGMGASGEMNLSVSDGRKLLIKLVGTMKGIAWKTEGKPETIACERCGQTLYSVNARNNTLVCEKCKHPNVIHISSGFTKSLQAAFRPLIVQEVKTKLPATIRQNNIDILEVEQHLDLLTTPLQERIRAGFEEYGLTIPQFYITNIVLHEDDPKYKSNFKIIRELHSVALQSKSYQAEAVIEASRREAVLQQQTTETEIARREAERKVIAAQAEAQAQRMQGLTEAEIMQAKGYSQRDVLQAEVQKAYAEGIGNMGPTISAGGGGGGSIVGDIMGLGVGMAAAQAVMPQLGNMFQGMNPAASGTALVGADAHIGPHAAEAAPSGEGMRDGPGSEAPASTWDCPACGFKNIKSKFCPECGAKKPEPKPADTWDCPACGTKGITSKFCPECGAKRPEAPKGWTCPECGTKDIQSKFCPNCGAKKPAETWTCPECGATEIKTKFCPECGHKKED